MQAYSDQTREHDPHALPDIEVSEMTAREVAERDEDLICEYSRRHEFRLAFVNNRTREAMLDAIVAEEGIQGGFYWWSCRPGCLPDSFPEGPFSTEAEALADARNF
jgi:hypothetical protein